MWVQIAGAAASFRFAKDLFSAISLAVRRNAVGGAVPVAWKSLLGRLLSRTSNLPSSVQIGDNRVMLLPRYSLRTTLFAITLSAMFFVIAGMAVRGRPWAIVTTIAVVSILATLAFHAGIFVLTSILTRYLGKQQTTALTRQGGLQYHIEQQLPPGTPHDSVDG